jgi:cytochrome c peroxidase
MSAFDPKRASVDLSARQPESPRRRLSAIRTVRNLLSHPSAVDARWRPLAPENVGRFQVPTLRNVDKRPSPNFVKAYGHNGYFKTLKSIVHFYNTRDTLRRCASDDPGEGTTCWPGPESTDNMNTKFVGRLGLSDDEEDEPVSFMRTLADGFMRR